MSNIPKETIQKLSIFQQEVNRLFKQLFEKKTEKNVVDDNVNFPVAADVYETNKSIVIEMELPGVPREDVDLSISGYSLIIKGHKRELKSNLEDKLFFQCMERDFGKFHRVIELPSTSDTSRVSAKILNGLLIVTLPKITERRGNTRKIDISGD